MRDSQECQDDEETGHARLELRERRVWVRMREKIKAIEERVGG